MLAGLELRCCLLVRRHGCRRARLPLHGAAGPSTSPILLPRKGIFVLRHAQNAKIIGESGISQALATLVAVEMGKHTL